MFAYCNNNPIMCFDPSGKNCLSIIAMISFFKYITKLIIKLFDKKLPEHISDAGVSFIADYETFSHTVYDDGNGNPTIGYGHLIKAGETYTYITKEEGLELFKNDLQTYENIVISYMQDNNISWNQHQFDSMVSVAFNAGKGGFGKIADRILSGVDVQDAFTWFYTREKAKKGGVNLGLWRRRTDEYEIFSFGTYERDYILP